LIPELGGLLRGVGRFCGEWGPGILIDLAFADDAQAPELERDPFDYSQFPDPVALPPGGPQQYLQDMVDEENRQHEDVPGGVPYGVSGPPTPSRPFNPMPSRASVITNTANR
jgi:hypothetical protein